MKRESWLRGACGRYIYAAASALDQTFHLPGMGTVRPLDGSVSAFEFPRAAWSLS